jgi:DNA polymerase-3 subunit epsilon
MLVLGLDTETTGLEPEPDRIIEIAAVLWDWDTKIPVQMISILVDHEIEIPEEIVKLTGITPEMILKYGILEEEACERLWTIRMLADYTMAHNAKFDRGFIEAARVRTGQGEWQVPWLCSMEDIKYPEGVKTRNLTHLAAEHGFVSPWKHRSLFDVLTMLKIASNYDLDAIIARSKEPVIYVQALVTYNDNQKAKDFNFRWNPDKKIWWKGQKQSDWEAERDGYQFKSEFMAGAPE